MLGLDAIMTVCFDLLRSQIDHGCFFVHLVQFISWDKHLLLVLSFV